MNSQLSERIFFITFRLHKSRRMIPVSGGLEFPGSCPFHKSTSICLVHPDIGIHEVTSRLPECLYCCLDRLRLVPVITVDNTDNVSGGIADTFVHGIVDPAVRFAEDMIADPARLEPGTVGFCDFHGPVPAGAVYDPVFDVRIGLGQYRLYRMCQCLLTVIGHRDNADQWLLFLFLTGIPGNG